MARIPFPTPDTMTPDQRRVYDMIVNGPRGTLIGPLRAAIHSPELADRWQRLGEFLRFRTCLPPRLGELAIIVTARRWNSQIEWYVHAAAAEKAGIPQSVIEALRCGDSPVFQVEDDAAVYEYVREMQELGQVSDTTYQDIVDSLGVVGVVELTALIGYYTMVSMTLNAHEIPLPNGAAPPLQPVAPGKTRIPRSSDKWALTKLPPGRLENS